MFSKAGLSQAWLAFVFVVPSIISTQLVFKDNNVEKQYHLAELLWYTVCRLCYFISVLLYTLEWFVNSVL